MSDPRGRQPIGVNQPPYGGFAYPFVNPSDDIAQLLADFYLAYDDDYSAYTLPFRVAWLHGFGTSSDSSSDSAPTGFPNPTHSHDLVVHDALGLTVFDSTAAGTFETKAWGTRLLILEWLTGTGVCRCTTYTAWAANQTPRDYADDIVPESSVLDARTYIRTPRRLRSLRVNGHTFNPGAIAFQEGYNCTIFEGVSTQQNVPVSFNLAGVVNSSDGKRKKTQITFQANPGDGLGVVPSCQDPSPTIQTINQVGPDAGGNLTLDASGCLRIQMPVSVADGIATVTAPGTLVISNDCEPCCPCNDYAYVYLALKKLWSIGLGLAERAEAARDQFATNIDRWNAQKSCRESQPFRVVAFPEAGCKASVGVSFCNTNKCCVAALQIRITFQVFSGTTDVTNTIDGSICPPVYRSGSGTQGEEEYVLSGTWPTFDAFFDFANPQDVSTLRFRVCAPACAPGMSIQTTVTALAPQPAANADGTACPLPTATVPAPVSAYWTDTPAAPARFVATRVVPLNSADPFLPPCGC